MKKIPR